MPPDALPLGPMVEDEAVCAKIRADMDAKCQQRVRRNREQKVRDEAEAKRIAKCKRERTLTGMNNNAVSVPEIAHEIPRRRFSRFSDFRGESSPLASVSVSAERASENPGLNAVAKVFDRLAGLTVTENPTDSGSEICLTEISNWLDELTQSPVEKAHATPTSSSSAQRSEMQKGNDSLGLSMSECVSLNVSRVTPKRQIADLAKIQGGNLSVSESVEISVPGTFVVSAPNPSNLSVSERESVLSCGHKFSFQVCAPRTSENKAAVQRMSTHVSSVPHTVESRFAVQHAAMPRVFESCSTQVSGVSCAHVIGDVSQISTRDSDSATRKASRYRRSDSATKSEKSPDLPTIHEVTTFEQFAAEQRQIKKAATVLLEKEPAQVSSTPKRSAQVSSVLREGNAQVPATTTTLQSTSLPSATTVMSCETTSRSLKAITLNDRPQLKKDAQSATAYWRKCGTPSNSINVRADRPIENDFLSERADCISETSSETVSVHPSDRATEQLAAARRLWPRIMAKYSPRAQLLQLEKDNRESKIREMEEFIAVRKQQLAENRATQSASTKKTNAQVFAAEQESTTRVFPSERETDAQVSVVEQEDAQVSDSEQPTARVSVPEQQSAQVIDFNNNTPVREASETPLPVETVAEVATVSTTEDDWW